MFKYYFGLYKLGISMGMGSRIIWCSLSARDFKTNLPLLTDLPTLTSSGYTHFPPVYAINLFHWLSPRLSALAVKFDLVMSSTPAGNAWDEVALFK
jgi:hypothetical protein